MIEISLVAGWLALNTRRLLSNAPAGRAAVWSNEEGMIADLPPKVLVSGYYGFHNAGDEAILYALVDGLRSLRPDVEITVLSQDPAHTARTYGVAAVRRADLKAVAGAMRKTDLFISGGGGLLQDTTSLASLQYYLGLIVLARLMGRKVFLYAQGIGPLRSRVGRVLTSAVLNRVNMITVRDEESGGLLEAIGVSKPPVKVTADPVLGLELKREWVEKGRRILAGLGLEPGKLAGVSVRPWPGQETVISRIAGLAEWLDSRGWRVVLLPFHRRVDREACLQVAARTTAGVTVVNDEMSVGELAGVCAHLGLAVGMRLHFLVFASLAGVPPVAIAYDPKVERFLERLGLQTALPVEGLTLRGLQGKVEYVINNLEALREQVAQRVEVLRRESRLTAELALDLIE